VSTAVDTAFEELVSAGHGVPEPLHLVCLLCHPNIDMPVPAVCGTMTSGKPRMPYHLGWCVECVALDLPQLPCGH
jgi:hypothetical protein